MKNVGAGAVDGSLTGKPMKKERLLMLIYLLKTLANYNAVDTKYEFWLSAPMLLAKSLPTPAQSTTSAPSLIALLSASHFSMLS